MTLPPELAKALGLAPAEAAPQTDAERLVEAQAHFDEITGRMVEACEAHASVQPEVEALIRKTFRVDVLPEAARVGFVRALAGLALHRHEHVTEAVAWLFGEEGARMNDLLLMTGAAWKVATQGLPGGAAPANPTGMYL